MRHEPQTDYSNKHMAGRGVDALANRARGLALTDGPTLLGEGAFGKVYKETLTVAVKKLDNFNTANSVPPR